MEMPAPNIRESIFRWAQASEFSRRLEPFPGEFQIVAAKGMPARMQAEIQDVVTGISSQLTAQALGLHPASRTKPAEGPVHV